MLVQTFGTPIHSEAGATFLVTVHGEKRADGTWEGWLEFTSEVDGSAFATERETTQPSLSALRYWASGLEPIYLDGAFRRAAERAKAYVRTPALPENERPRTK